MSKYVIKHSKNFEKIRLIGAEKKIAKITSFFSLLIKIPLLKWTTEREINIID